MFTEGDYEYCYLLVFSDHYFISTLSGNIGIHHVIPNLIEMFDHTLGQQNYDCITDKRFCKNVYIKTL